MTPSPAQCLAWALTGELLETAAGGPGSGVVARARALLAAHGWDQAAVREHAAARQAAEQPWPHPLPEGWVGPGGHAQLQAGLQQLLDELGARAVRPPGPSAPLSARDRQLIADRPPHW
ncbi:hypothetical protein GC722_11290 [Auraticoccus sp. F435]|uniref:Uncharacterized protein n=1 Tax=Auraticoccus cholistanensis TaxID=2656650 RepID=A0A6A9UXZ0_9ACTN|nr:hypothetical protein [Auraticoccus cholistanensis]MVA76602.1 hypothetical protein [Auraticoccus cholistanensis]